RIPSPSTHPVLISLKHTGVPRSLHLDRVQPMQIPKENRSRFSESDFELHNRQITRLPISLVSAQLHQFVLRWLNANQFAGNALVCTAAVTAVTRTARQLQFVTQLIFELLQLVRN